MSKSSYILILEITIELDLYLPFCFRCFFHLSLYLVFFFVAHFDMAKDDEMDDLRDEATEALDATMDNAEEQHEQQISQVSHIVRQHHFDDEPKITKNDTFQGTQAFQDMATPNATVALSSSQVPERVANAIKPPTTKKAHVKAKAKAKASLEAITMDESETKAVESIRDDDQKRL